MAEERFVRLVEEQKGFEYILAYRDDEDHILGGKGDRFWYAVSKNGKVKKTWEAVLRDGVWEDLCITGEGARKTEKKAAAGTTIGLIEKEAYLCQDEDWVTRRTPAPVEDSHPHYHYVKGFGDKALDVSVQYGVTIGYSDLADVPAGFHLRYLYTGEDVTV